MELTGQARFGHGICPDEPDSPEQLAADVNPQLQRDACEREGIHARELFCGCVVESPLHSRRSTEWNSKQEHFPSRKALPRC